MSSSQSDPSSSPNNAAVGAAANAPPAAPPVPRVPGPRVFGRFGFWIVVVPFIVYLSGTMIGGNLEDMRVSKIEGTLGVEHDEEANRPKSKDKKDISQIQVDPNARFLFNLLPLGRNSFPYTYPVTIAATTLCALAVSWGYFKAPLRISVLSILVGAVGIVAWIALVELDRRYLGLGALVSKGRPGFNPFAELKDNPTFLWQFLAIRFFGLAALVPLVEEFFLRGFLMRYVDDPDWDEIPLGTGKTGGWISPTIYGLISHPAEPLAALVWFSLVSRLYKRTGSIWDCVVAHAVTNLLLGLYVVKFGAWHLW